METLEQPRIKHKTFSYQTALKWVGGKAGVLGSEGKHSFRVASPREFKGEAGVWTPEDLMVGAVEVCHLTTFLAYAQRKQLPLISYESKATGVLEFIDGDYRVSRIILSPRIMVGNTVTEPEVYELLRESHKHCIISNSINSIVEVNPTVLFQ